MGKIFEKNLKQLEKMNPEFSKNIYSEENIEFIVKTETINEREVLYIEYPDKVVQLESLYDNDIVNDIWLNNVLKDVKFNTKIFVYGIGNISFIRGLFERTGEDNTIIIHEPNFSILREIMERVDITDILGNKRCILVMGNCLGDSLRNTYELFINYTDCFNYILITSMNYNSIFEDDYKDYIHGIDLAFSTIASNYKFYSNSGKHINRNVFKNVKYILNSKSLTSFNKLVNKDVPAILVAAGPSLTKNIKYLKDAKGKAIIICIDAAMRALARENITPDLCVTVDFNKELGHFDEGDSNMVPMICSIISTPTFIEQNKAVKLFYKECTPYINEYFEDNNIPFDILPTGGTVANNALSAAIHMGCKNIIIIGQDLAYTNNQTHAAGTVKGDSHTVDAVEGLSYIEDLEGNEIATCGEFILYKQWIEETVEARKDVHFINATEGGAGIKGCEHITLKEAIDKYCKEEVNVNELLNNTEELFTDEQREGFIKFICSIPDAIKKVEKDALTGKNNYDKMLKMIENNSYNDPSFKKLFKKTKKIGVELEKNDISSMIFNEIQEEMNDTMKTIFSSEEDNVKSELRVVCTQGRESFDRIAKAAKELQQFVTEQLKEY